MLFQLVSDLHLDFDKDKGYNFVDKIETNEAQTLIIAGDLCELRDTPWKALRRLEHKYPNILYVLGNHEFYGSDWPQTLKRHNDLGATVAGLIPLENQEVVIDGVKFAGATLWHPYHEHNENFYGLMYDFKAIDKHLEFVYEANKKSVEFFKNTDADVWITHHLPSAESVHSRFWGQQSNRFFVCDLHKLILERQPKMVLHGHTHLECNYMIKDTKVICNPRGYPNENYGPYTPLTLEIE